MKNYKECYLSGGAVNKDNLGLYLQYDETAEHWLLLTSSYFNYITSVVGISLGEVFVLAILA